MHADLKGALDQINKSYRAFEHNGKSLTKDQVRKILQYGIDRGYKTTADIKDEEIECILKSTI